MHSFTTRRSRGGIPRGRPYKDRAHDENDINLQQLVHDAYYSMNVTQLAKHALFLLLGIFMMLMHVSTMNGASNTAYFRTSVTQQLATTFDPNNQNLPTWQNVDSFAGALDYYTNFLEAAINASDERTQALGDDSSVMLGAYGRVMYARIIVNFQENCKHWRGYDSVVAQRERCITANAKATVKDGSTTLPDLFAIGQGANYTRWHDSAAKFYSFRSSSNSHTDWSALVVIANGTSNTGTSSPRNRDYFRQVLAEEVTPAHVAAIDKYAYAVGLDIIAFNTLTDSDYAIFSLRAQRSGDGQGVAKDSFQRLSVTTPGKRYLYTTHRDSLRRALEVVFWLAFFWLVSLDYAQWRLARRQGCSLLRYVSTPWNTYTILINLTLLAWLLWYLVLLSTWALRYNSMGLHNPTLATCADFYRYEYFPAKYTEWVYWGIAVVLLVGMRMLQFSRLHSGLNVFHDVFVKTMRDLADFFAVFIFIVCLFGTCVYLIFQVSGGNPNWVTWWDGTSVLSRLAFQFADYNDIYNNGIGAGRWGPVITAIFWLSVAALLVWSGNIFLSAVSYAYGAIRDRNPQVEVFFLWEVLLRFFSFFAHLYWMLIGHRLMRDDHLVRSPTILPPVPSGGAAPAPPPPTYLELVVQPNPPNDGPGSPAPPPAERSQRSGLMQYLMPGRSLTSAEVDLPRSGSRGGAGAVLQGNRRPPLEVLRAPRRHTAELWERCRAWWHLTDIRFYRLFYTTTPAKSPRWYMLSRWAVASRPEMRALAVYFTDFRTFRLAKPPATASPAAASPNTSTSSLLASPNSLALSQSFPPPGTAPGDPQQQHGAATLSPLERSSLCYHLVAVGEDAATEEWLRHGVREFITQDRLKRLLDEVQRVHPATLACARPWFTPLFPMRMTKYLLGYFWQERMHEAIMDAIKKVYNPQFMKDIESSFAIDEDEEGAVPTLRDLQARVQEPMAALTKRTAALERSLHKMEAMLHRLLEERGTGGLHRGSQAGDVDTSTDQAEQAV